MHMATFKLPCACIRSKRQLLNNISSKIKVTTLLGVSAFAIIFLTYYIYQASRMTEYKLSVLYLDEAVMAIERFHVIFDSYEAHNNPDIYSQILTGRYLDEYKRSNRSSLNSIIVTESLEVNGLRILEYTDNRMRVIGCSTLLQARMNLTDELTIRAFRPRMVRWIYVFEREDSYWKVATHSYIGDADLIVENWSNVEDWRKEIIGDPTDFIRKPCFELTELGL